MRPAAPDMAPPPCGQDPLSQLEEQLARDDAARADRTRCWTWRQTAGLIAVCSFLFLSGLMLVIFGTRPMGIVAVFPGCVLIYGGGYCLPAQIYRLRRRRWHQDHQPR